MFRVGQKVRVCMYVDPVQASPVGYEGEVVRVAGMVTVNLPDLAYTFRGEATNSWIFCHDEIEPIH